ncbi:54S ribosomal protein L24 [Penicillium chermesinum]|uniref:Large ribosomal subunit protein bL28m n=1 Tax=Penicillium chermesinum TaxID=63820 RepID=A0A9W9NQ26_9EURO|nr:54S ribosomal protein L24 [Penicillium chermesinum]KAJ5224067.1 54S ribosomal protein L24 [Penicillium chermesinum]KAJ6155118.1 54S ribosomal protein L24 [Penicillium chermesinum]
MAGFQSRVAIAGQFSLASAFRSLSLSIPKRSFSTTPAQQTTQQLPAHVPPYPYGPRQWYKQADTGLYGGASIRFGNKISKGRNQGKTRRSWKPNVRRKKLRSDALDQDLFIKVTHRALRTIEKEGGLDNYLLSDRPSRIKELGIFGWHLRWQVMQTPSIQERFREERKKLGIPEPLSMEEWLKSKEDEINATVEERLNIKDITKPRLKGRADPSRFAQKKKPTYQLGTHQLAELEMAAQEQAEREREDREFEELEREAHELEQAERGQPESKPTKQV